MTTEETVKQYAQDLLVECGWDRKAIDNKVSVDWLRQMADVDPAEWKSKLWTALRIARETERVLINRETVRDRYQEFFPKRNEW